jgi:ABC-2 type transport system permease protein
MSRWRIYYTFAKKSFLRSAAYRFDVWSRIFSNLIFLLTWSSIWIALYGGKEEANGISFTSMLTYVAVSQFLSAVNSAGTPLWEIQEKVRTGDIALELMRPFDVPLRYLFADFGSVAFYIITAVLPVYILLFLIFDFSLPDSWSTWVLFIFSALLGFLIRYAIELTFGLFAFWLVETGGVVDLFYFAMSLLSGSVIPLWFFPDWLQSLAFYLPFQGIYFIPNAIFIGEISGAELLVSIAIQCFWVIASFLLLRIVWHRAANKVIVQGG